MTNKTLPTPDVLRQLLRYEPDTGRLFWREAKPSMFEGKKRSAIHLCAIWNSKYFGKEAFTSTAKSGHKRGRVCGFGFLAHRVIWAIYYGEWPDKIIDHINMNPADNRLANLRLATKRQNGCNRKAFGVSKFLGVVWRHDAQKWRASISVNNKTHYLGLYENEEDAAKAYDIAAKDFHGEFARLNETTHSL